ncbi:unnamed protein product [Urochloa humidicola]
MAANSPFDCILLDLDDTLYPGNTGLGLGPALKRNIDEFLQAKLGVSAAMRVELFRTHGSSLAGLIALGYDVHPDEYHTSAEHPKQHVSNFNFSILYKIKRDGNLTAFRPNQVKQLTN